MTGLLLCACVQEHMDVVYNPDNVTTQALGQITGCVLAEDGDPIITTYSEANFNLPIAPAAYTLYVDRKGNGFANAKKVDASISEGKISIEQKKLNKTFLNMGCEPGKEFPAEFCLFAYMKTDRGANIEAHALRSNFVETTFTTFEEKRGDFDVVDVPGDYQGWKPADYPKLFNYSYDEINYRGVVDFKCTSETGDASKGFKITYGGNWDNDSGNWGSEAQAEPAEAASIQLVNGDGSQNIVCYGEKRYYMFNFNRETLKLDKLYGFDCAGIIGLGNDWDNDVVMDYNMYFGRFWADVTITEATEFKFRLDHGWDFNWGGSLDELSAGGANIPIEAGNYRIYFYMGTEPMTAEIDAEMYGKKEPTVKQEEDDPVYKGWGIIGDFNSWAADVPMTEVGGVWTGYANIDVEQGFKLRKDSAWDDNRGAEGDVEPFVITSGEPINAVAGGKNLAVPAKDFYEVVYDSNNETITVTSVTRWGVIGDFNEWAADVYMTESGGSWTSPAIKLEAGKGFKLRKNAGWDENRGAKGDVEPYELQADTPVKVEHNGKNFTVPVTAEYVIRYDVADETVTATPALPSDLWGLIGVNGDWDNDIFMEEVMPGVWVSPKTTINTSFKLRYDHDWADNRGSALLSFGGPAQVAVFNGPNIEVEPGSYVVVYNANLELIYLQGWSIIGKVMGDDWGKDFPLTPLDMGEGDIAWLSEVFRINSDSAFKIRFNGGWDVNRGGTFTSWAVPFAVTNNGADITVGADSYCFVAYNPATEEIGIGRADWSIIGGFNSWGGDIVMMEKEPGIYSAELVLTEATEFKIRKDRAWDTDRGGTMTAPGTPFEAVSGGPNISIAAGSYEVVYNSNEETITVSEITE